MSSNIVVVDLPRGSIDVAGVIEKFYDLNDDNVIWKTIKRLAKKKVEAIISLLSKINANHGRLIKHWITSDPIESRAMLQDLIGNQLQTSQDKSEEVDIEHDPMAMVAAEIHIIFSIASVKFP